MESSDMYDQYVPPFHSDFVGLSLEQGHFLTPESSLEKPGSSVAKSDSSTFSMAPLKTEYMQDSPSRAAYQYQMQLLNANASSSQAFGSNAFNGGSPTPSYMPVDHATVGSLLRLRLPMWGTTNDCLKMYKRILETGQFQGQKVPKLDYVHRDLNLVDGEVYLCSVPWLLAGIGENDKDPVYHTKPRTPHHTFKFQRLGPKRGPGDMWHRKARCSRRGCGCVEESAFEVVGVKLVNNKDEVTLYHFQKTPINKSNIHPRKGNDNTPSTPSGLFNTAMGGTESPLELNMRQQQKHQQQQKALAAAAMQRSSAHSTPMSDMSVSSSPPHTPTSPSYPDDPMSSVPPPVVPTLPFPNMSSSDLQSLIEANIKYLKSQVPMVPQNTANNTPTFGGTSAPRTTHCIDERGSFDGGYRVAVFGDNLLNAGITFSLPDVWSQSAQVADPNAKLAGGVITVVAPQCPFLDVSTMREITCDVQASLPGQVPAVGQSARFTYDAWRSITNCLMAQLQSGGVPPPGGSGNGGGGPSGGGGMDPTSRPGGPSGGGPSGGGGGGGNPYGGYQTGGGGGIGGGGGGMQAAGGSGTGTGTGAGGGNDDDEDDYEDVDEFGDPVPPEGSISSIRSIVDRRVLMMLQALVARTRSAAPKVLNSRGATGHTLLHIICLFGLEQSAAYAIQHGADPSVPDTLQVLPIHVAARWWPDCPESLVETLVGSGPLPSAPPRGRSGTAYSSLASYSYACGNKRFGDLLAVRTPQMRHQIPSTSPTIAAVVAPPTLVLKRLAECLAPTTQHAQRSEQRPSKSQRTTTEAQPKPPAQEQRPIPATERTPSQGLLAPGRSPREPSPRDAALAARPERAVVIQSRTDEAGLRPDPNPELVPLITESSACAAMVMPADSVPLLANPFVIGRDLQRANLRFPAAVTSLSGSHAEIFRDSTGRHVLRDSSQNGTWHMSASDADNNSCHDKPPAQTRRLRKGDEVELFDNDELWLPVNNGFAHFKFLLSHTVT